MTTSHCVPGMVTVCSLQGPSWALTSPLGGLPIYKEGCNQETAELAFWAPVGLQSCSF